MKVLVVEDEDILRISIGDDLKEAGFEVSLSKSPLLALDLLEKEEFDVALIDYKMPEMNGLELLKRVKHEEPDCVVIIMTAFGTIQTAVEAMKLGAYDYITKPFSNEELILILNRIAEVQSLRRENIELKEKLKERHSFHKLIGKSKPMQKIYDLLAQVANSDSTVLITGETGTGKEMVADAIHYTGMRQDRPYIKVSCALFSKDILESELFGHEKGAFTGAVEEKKGRFQLAHTGTLFLDDVDDIPLELQVKLLRVLQHNEFERVGGTETLKVDVRIIAASKADLLDKVKREEFREDLYYRLNVVPIHLPPLRERKEDIPLLIDSFIEKYSSGKRMRITNQAMEHLLDYSWPGNVRELENLIERLALTAEKSEITTSQLPHEIVYEEILPRAMSVDGSSFKDIIKQTEINLIQRALGMAGGNKFKAARLLKLKPSTLRSK
ncbi:MAG: sigma-54-dependent transcriptional regulator, partial [Candidatus Aminicenantales bacterium]